MKTSWTVDAGVLRITVKDGRREQSWVVRQSHKPEVQANTFAEIAEALGMKAIVPPLQSAPYPTDFEALAAADHGLNVERLARQRMFESPERTELRKQAEAVLAGAVAAKAIQDSDEGVVGRLPEVMGRESEEQVTDTRGFQTLPAAAVAVDGSVYKDEDYRTDRSNWVK